MCTQVGSCHIFYSLFMLEYASKIPYFPHVIPTPPDYVLQLQLAQCYNEYIVQCLLYT